MNKKSGVKSQNAEVRKTCVTLWISVPALSGAEGVPHVKDFDVTSAF
jgi:hypothetical protein